MSNSSRIEALAITLLLLLGIFSVQLTLDPSYSNMGSDSALFAYCGKVIAHGGLMYRDCYDHKPIYLVTGRMSPSRYVFPALFLTITMPDDQGFVEWMRDIQKDPPELILSNTLSLNGIPHLGLEEEQLWVQCRNCRNEIKRVLYRFKQSIIEIYLPISGEIDGWQVYQRKK